MLELDLIHFSLKLKRQFISSNMSKENPLSENCFYKNIAYIYMFFFKSHRNNIRKYSYSYTIIRAAILQ